MNLRFQTGGTLASCQEMCVCAIPLLQRHQPCRDTSSTTDISTFCAMLCPWKLIWLKSTFPQKPHLPLISCSKIVCTICTHVTFPQPCPGVRTDISHWAAHLACCGTDISHWAAHHGPLQLTLHAVAVGKKSVCTPFLSLLLPVYTSGDWYSKSRKYFSSSFKIIGVLCKNYVTAACSFKDVKLQ